MLRKHVPADFLKTQQLECDHHHTLGKLEQSQQDLRQRMMQLEILNQELIEAHKTILDLTQRMETVRQEVKEQIMSQIRFLLLPLLEHMRAAQETTPCENYVGELCQFIVPVAPVPSPALYAHTSLTSQELRIISMIRQGMTNDNIAAQLYIAPTTVKTHRRNIRKKLGLAGAKNRLQTYFQTAEIKLPTFFIGHADHTTEGKNLAN